MADSNYGTSTSPRESRIEQAHQWLEGQASSMETLLAELVRQNSHTFNVTGGKRVGDMLREALVGSAIDCELVRSQTFADHLVFRTPAVGAPIALVGHLDTVFPAGTFEGYRTEGGKAFGPGVLDMKGGLVVAGYALLALRTLGVLAQLPMSFVIVSDEEVGSPESQPLLRRVGEHAHCALVFEAGRLNDAIVTRRKGTGSIQVRARGVAAHAGSAHREGANAIWALARFVDRAQSLTDYERGVTVNVGKVSGGQGKNTVPEEATADIDIRFTSQGSAAALVEALRDAAADASRSVAGTALELSGGVSRLPLERTERSSALFEEYAACARRAGLGGDESPLEGGGSDANTLASIGVPAIDGLGPRGSFFHTKNEYIERTTLVPRARALAEFLLGRLPQNPVG